MTTDGQVLLAAVGAFVVVAVLLLRSGGRDPLAYVAAFFGFFGLGPAVNHLLGNPIYVGIAIPKLGAAALGVLWALLAMMVVGLLMPLRPGPWSRDALRSGDRTYPGVTALLVGLIVYPLATVMLRGPAMFAGTKLDRIAAAGTLHYQYLLLELLACAMYFLAGTTPLGRRLYWINMVTYIGYCLLTTERDFLFVLFALLLHRQLFGKPMSLRIGLAGLGAAVGATVLAALRGGEATTSAAVLNQGSTMFVDTFVRAYVPAVMPHHNGQTYVDAVLAFIPGSGAASNLAGWLLDRYAPGSSSGYGFSLIAEAYLNFGTIGIPIVFAVLTVGQRLLVNRVDQGQFPAYLSLLFTIAWMYNFRGESSTLLSILVYGVVLYGVVGVLIQRRATPTVTTPGPLPARKATAPWTS